MRLASRQSIGFTLIEAVLAVAIISMSAMALLVAASRCTTIARSAKNYHAALAVLDQGELEHPAVLTNEVDDNAVDEYEPLNNGFKFKREIEPLSDAEADEDMFIMRTKVSWPAQGRTVFEEVETLIYSTNHEDRL